MPVSGGRAWTIWLKASRPPAEAPMPTMGNCAPGVLVDSGATLTGSGGEAGEPEALLGGFGEREPEAPLGGLGRLPAGFFRATATSWLLLESAAVSRNDQSKARPGGHRSPWLRRAHRSTCPKRKIQRRIRATGSFGGSRARSPQRHTARS